MWIVYKIQTFQVLGKFYVKHNATVQKNYLERIDSRLRGNLGLDKVPNIKELDKWKMWKVLGG